MLLDKSHRRFGSSSARGFLNLLTLLVAAITSSFGAQRLNPNTAFEEFIANPPIIEEMIYSLTYGTEEASRHYQVRWQTNAFLHRELPALRDAYKPTPSPMANFTSAYGKRVWQFDDLNGITSYDTNEGSMVSLPAKLDAISTVLNAGVPNLAIASIKWTNNSFTAVSPRTGFQFTGVMHYDDNGAPEWMNVAIDSGKRVAHSVIKYRHTAELGVEGLPNKFEHYSLNGTKSEPFRVVTIHSIRTRKTPLGRESFDLTPFARANNSTARWLENGEWKYYDELGKVQTIQKLNQP